MACVYSMTCFLLLKSYVFVWFIWLRTGSQTDDLFCSNSRWWFSIRFFFSIRIPLFVNDPKQILSRTSKATRLYFAISHPFITCHVVCVAKFHFGRPPFPILKSGSNILIFHQRYQREWNGIYVNIWQLQPKTTIFFLIVLTDYQRYAQGVKLLSTKTGIDCEQQQKNNHSLARNKHNSLISL